jgi:hypothetical protein
VVSVLLVLARGADDPFKVGDGAGITVEAEGVAARGTNVSFKVGDGAGITMEAEGVAARGTNVSFKVGGGVGITVEAEGVAAKLFSGTVDGNAASFPSASSYNSSLLQSVTLRKIRDFTYRGSTKATVGC